MKLFKTIRLPKKKLMCVIGGVIIVGLATTFLAPKVENVFNVHIAKAERKLPIYCVETSEKKVAISFDAA